MAMAHRFKGKRERVGIKAVPQHELDAEAVREKTERLKALRLAHEASNTAARPAAAGRHTSVKKKPRKSGEKALNLSEWLATQQKEGRRN
jgi:hypothetical protein